jgi:ADP-heptose:LPS heptosyltransferase
LPAIRIRREALHPTQVEIMGHPWILQLVEGRYYADGIADVNKAEVAPFFQDGAHLPEAMCRYFRGFDVVFVFGKGATFSQNLKRTGVKEVFQLPPFSENGTHLVDHHLSSIKALGISSISSSPKIFLRQEDKRWAQEYFQKKGWSLAGIIAIHPGAGSRKKVWPSHRFASLGRMLKQRGKKLFVIQGPADDKEVTEVLQGLNGVPHLVASELPLIKLGALLSQCILYIGNDSGISHLAAALGVPTVAIFGPTDPHIWSPRGERAFWMHGKIACSPCSWEKRQRCKKQKCFDTIDVEDLMELVTGSIGFHQ